MYPNQNGLKHFLNLFMLIVFLILITYPRFNRHDYGFSEITSGQGIEFKSDKDNSYKNLSIDAYQYLLLVKYFRNPCEQNKNQLKPPFCYRPLTPFLSSFLPFDEMTSLNLVNLIFLIAVVFLLEKIISIIGVKGYSKYFSIFIFLFSFPTFYYSTIGYIDPAFIFFLTLGIYLLLNANWIYFPLFIFIAAFAKEGIALLLPIAVYSIKLKKNKQRSLIIIVISIAAFLLAIYITRTLFSSNSQYFWFPSFQRVIENITRFPSIFSVIISWVLFIIILILFLFEYYINKNINISKQYINFFIFGTFITCCYCIYGFFAAWVDGRFVWPAYVFLTPIASVYLDNKLFSANSDTNNHS